MSTTNPPNQHLFNVCQAIVGNDPRRLVRLLDLVSSLYAKGAIMTGSAHPLFKDDVVPNDFDFILPGSWQDHDKRLHRLAGQVFEYKNLSFFWKGCGKKVIDLVFERNPPKEFFIDGVRCVEPKLLLRSYRQNDEDREGKNDRLKISITEAYIAKHPQVQASCSTGDDTDRNLVSVCRKLF